MSELMVDTDTLRIGVATAALQIEGGDRGNNWYDWAQRPGTIADGSTPLRATDHWNRWRDDTAMMAELGVQIYRMSVEWSRIEPEPGLFDDSVLERYREELATIREVGIVPLVTLHHFAHPRWFEEMGGWGHPSSVEVFCRFTRRIVGALGDLVNEWCTINEPNVYATQAWLFSEGPPGRKSWRNLRRTLRHMAEAHCRVYTLIHDLQPEATVCFAHHMRSFVPMDEANPLHRAANRLNRHLFQDVIAEAMLRGRFSPLLGRPRGIVPGRYYDVLGLNYYSRTATSGFAADGVLPGSPINDLGWEIYPDGLVECARELVERYEAPVWITENGTCDNPTASRIESFRSRFLFDHLSAVAASGLPIERYYHWCFVDNWEWSDGEVPRFGIVGLDYDTQERTIKPSGRFLADVIAHGGITKDAHDRFVTPETYRYLS